MQMNGGKDKGRPDDAPTVRVRAVVFFSFFFLSLSLSLPPSLRPAQEPMCVQE